MPLSAVFVYGFFGAFAADFHEFYTEVCGLPPGNFPDKYRRVSYWVPRLMHALIGGCFALAWAETYIGANPLMLIAVGGSSKLIVVKFGQMLTEMKTPGGK